MILTAKSTFTPGDTRHLLDLYVQVRVFTAVRKSQEIVEAHAKANCPVQSGELQGSIQTVEPLDDGKRIVGRVVAAADHAGFIEFGTGLRGSGTYPYDLPTAGVPITGSWIYDYKNQGWVGMPAQPYMRPALDTARGEVLQEFGGQ